MRYSLRKISDRAWSVVDVFTDLPLVIDDQVVVDMEPKEAYAFVDLLNRIDLQRRHIFDQH